METTHAQKFPSAKDWIMAARPKTLLIGVSAVVIASALAFQVDSFKLIPAIICLAFVILAQTGANLANDYLDFLKGVDTTERKGFKRAVASGIISVEAMKTATILVLATAFLVGCLLIPYGGWILLIIGILSILAALGYTAGPFPLAYNGLGDVTVLVFFGLVAVMFSYFVQTGSFSFSTFWCGFGVGMIAANVRLVNDLRDIKSDKKAGKRTLVIIFGPKFGIKQYFLSMVLALLVPIILYLMDFSAWIFLPLFLTIWAIKLSVKLMEAKDGSQFNHLLEQTVKFLLGYSLLLSVGILLS